MTTPRKIPKDLDRLIERNVRDVAINLAEGTPKRTI